MEAKMFRIEALLMQQLAPAKEQSPEVTKWERDQEATEVWFRLA